MRVLYFFGYSFKSWLQFIHLLTINPFINSGLKLLSSYIACYNKWRPILYRIFHLSLLIMWECIHFFILYKYIILYALDSVKLLKCSGVFGLFKGIFHFIVFVVFYSVNILLFSIIIWLIRLDYVNKTV